MRVFYCIFILLFSHQIFADQRCEKIKNYIHEHLIESGILKQDAAGFVYVDIDNDYICKLIGFIKDDGFEEPPYFDRPNGHGAHISVIYATEAQRYSVGKVKEVGDKIFFKIKDCMIVEPPSWPEVKAVYLITVEASVLDKIRKEYGLSKSKFDYHITIGVKSNQIEKQAA